MTDGKRWMAKALIGLTSFGLAASVAEARVPAGVWANPSNSVQVRFAPCGRGQDAQLMCGTVIWASEQAKADAARGGSDRLVGTRLFTDFEEEEPGRWAGTVFIPDIGREVEGTITQVDAKTLVGEGCLFGGLGCRQQRWRRVK
ncbi:hypothetical protein SPKIRA_05830 [Sphingomonas paucimobilis]|uniref:DNA, contig: SP614 n=2 Tax=Sphingomonas paucimobilis TaxID=13689 RepID=A0A0C9MQ75_SPHPI|nr:MULTISPECIES: DUF2147 domain-containing protein [Sphingomonas]MCM3679160.1 DUF2147 domain-containing protein [Sphingomonas paucimobilis]MDG5971913.1 hypothetical protein [Sphingomonas paucimobilis]SUJ16748.1 Uncharacterized protein conserved in bacteria [Sphingomonas paucimobilis]BCI69753.1 hypothetical protein SPKIRA_05830 [Sphingomonas paucimobilis]GAN12911.1 hypothetical protein SP6_14_00670 [Sphingomonas paucimobilis NBRC 13935]